MSQVINISGYKFIKIVNPIALRPRLRNKCLSLNLKGTILVSPEGINIVMAGTQENIDAFTNFLTSDERFADMAFKYSPSDHQPFNRMLVRLKKEIIAFGEDDLDPINNPAPFVKPKVLEKWLDEGKDIVFLDTRNDYEVKLGTFKNALTPHMDSFKDFKEVVADLDDSLKEKTIVTFCTGGVRCEKAAPYMIKKGFKDVHQIDGGVLKYFEECGGKYWQGDCFVFDHRVAVSPTLKETENELCYRCRHPLTQEDLESPEYVEDVSCPHCFNKNKKLATQKEPRV